MNRWRIFLLLLIVPLVFACGDDDDDDNDSGDDDVSPVDDDDDDDSAVTPDDDTGDDDDVPCEEIRPIVFAHGFLEVGDAFANQAMRFAANGACRDRIYAFDWNTLTGSGDQLQRLGMFIDDVLAETGAQQVDLVGHSAGTFLSRLYLNEPANAAKVAHFGNLAGSGADALPGGVPTINICSPDDYMAGTGDIEGAENVEIPGLDHLQVSTAPEVFYHLYRFFNEGEEPATEEMTPTEELELSGRLLTFAVNDPAVGYTMNVYPIDPETGERLVDDPVATFVTDADGFWGPFAAEPSQHYEYEIIDPNPYWRPLHYYREPLPRSCDLVYFRVFPPPLSLPGIALGILPYRDDRMLPATLMVNRAVVAGRDTLYVDGLEVSTDALAAPEKTTIAVFYFDANFNGVSDGRAPGGLYNFLFFLAAFDLIVPTDPPRAVPFEFNGRTLAARNWKSDSEGIVIVMFE